MVGLGSPPGAVIAAKRRDRSEREATSFVIVRSDVNDSGLHGCRRNHYAAPLRCGWSGRAPLLLSTRPLQLCPSHLRARP